MATRALFSYLQLCYPPISNYDFTIQKNLKSIQDYLNQGHIYIITQRPVLVFDNLTAHPDFKNPKLCFNIKQKGSDKMLECQLPICQENLCAQNDPLIRFESTFANPKPKPIPKIPPFGGVANFRII